MGLTTLISSLHRVMEQPNDHMDHDTLTTKLLLQKEAREKRRMVQLQKRSDRMKGTKIYIFPIAHMLYIGWEYENESCL